MIQALEAKVDPFDLDVFTPHISSRVKLAAHRVQVRKLFSYNSKMTTKSGDLSLHSVILLNVVGSEEGPGR